MKQVILVCILFLLTACGGIEGKQYRSTGQDFDLFNFFDGNIKAWGVVQGRDGNILQRFEVDIDGSVKDGKLTLDETFTYSMGDGVKKRVWMIENEGSGLYSGTAGDILEVASGQDFGNAFFWTYKMDLPVDDTTYRVTFKDWIWAFDENHIINRSYIKKFGIKFAEVTIFMEKN